MRQINADALKEEIIQYFNDVMDINEIKTINTVISIIDNAPTVKPEPYFEKAEKDKRIYELGFKDGQNARPQGDLISREALKKAIMFKDNANEETWEQLYDSVLEEIDNAPTVNPEITEEQAIDKLYETGWIIRHDKEMTERPQGKRCEMKSRLDKSIEYIRGYCIKHINCEECKLNDDVKGRCSLKNVPCNWQTINEMSADTRKDNKE